MLLLRWEEIGFLIRGVILHRVAAQGKIYVLALFYGMAAFYLFCNTATLLGTVAKSPTELKYNVLNLGKTKLKQNVG